MNDWIDAERRVERAQSFCDSRQWAEALAEMDEALTLFPENSAWHTLRGYLLFLLGRDGEAAVAYEKAIEVDPNDREVRFVLGIALARLGRFDRAAHVLEELSGLDPEFEPAYCHRIFLYTELGFHDRAEEVFYLAQQIDENCPNCFVQMGESLAARGQWERAIYCWKRALEISPLYPGVHHRVARACRSLGRLEEAGVHYLAEYRLEPGNTDLLASLAEIAIAAGKTELAIERFKQIIELDERNSQALFRLGQLLLERNDPEKALECFDAVYAIDGARTAIPRLALRSGEALLRLGRLRPALERLEAAAQEFELEEQGQLLLADCLLGLHRPSEAALCYQRVLALDSTNAAAHLGLGLCLFRTGQGLNGLTHCRRSVQLRPECATTLRATAAACLALGQWKEAKGLLRRAQTLTPRNQQTGNLHLLVWRYRFRRFLHRFIGIRKPHRKTRISRNHPRLSYS